MDAVDAFMDMVDSLDCKYYGYVPERLLKQVMEADWISKKSECDIASHVGGFREAYGSEVAEYLLKLERSRYFDKADTDAQLEMCCTAIEEFYNLICDELDSVRICIVKGQESSPEIRWRKEFLEKLVERYEMVFGVVMPAVCCGDA